MEAMAESNCRYAAALLLVAWWVSSAAAAAAGFSDGCAGERCRTPRRSKHNYVDASEGRLQKAGAVHN
jgi:hypothetical protein